jgi:hypothetical protein
MRVLGLLAAFSGVIVLGAVALSNTVFRPAPAATRLAGVSVQWVDFHITDLDAGRHRLDLTVRLHSPWPIDQCVAFALDGPFAGRRLEPASGSCPKPVAGDQDVALTFDRLTDSDVSFPSHTIVWGVPGGRCGIVFELFGVCVVDQAGTVPLELPRPSSLPSFGPIGSFLPIFSFEPIR